MRGILKLVFLLCIFSGAIPAVSQRIVYSEPDRKDSRQMNFEIIGKVDNHFLVYKSTKSKQVISVLDNDMKEVAQEDLKYMPHVNNLINVDFFPYTDFAYGIYQYKKKNIVYCMAVKLDGNGRRIGEPIELDTTKVNSSSSKIYTVLSSEDKSRLMVFKINTRNKKNYLFSTLLLDNELNELKRSRMEIPMDERNENIGEFHLDNDGDLIFSKFLTKSSDKITDASFVLKYANADTLTYRKLDLEKFNLDDIRIKIDNFNRRYILTTFYSTERRGNLDGYYFYIWDKATQTSLLEKLVPFSDDFRAEVRRGRGSKSAFNDHFVQQIIARRDGGFIVSSEAYYTTSRYNNWNRWNYLHSPFTSRFDYYTYYSPYYRNYWGWNRWNDNQSVRHHAENIAVSSFDKEGNLEWNNVISKEQFDDQSDALLSFQIMNTGGLLHFIFNQYEKRLQLLSDYTISAEGELKRSPTLKNLDKGYEFMPRYAKQVSARQMIVPCITRSYICFAKIEFN